MGGRRISEGETVKTLDALADALGSGMSLLGYLDNRAASRLIDSAVRREMASALRRGASLSDAVDAWANLSTAEASLLRAGEQAGRMADALHSLARAIEERGNTRRRVAMALAYPAFLVVVGSLVMPLPTLVRAGWGAYFASAFWGPLLVLVAGLLVFVLAPRLPRESRSAELLWRVAFAVPLLGRGLRSASRATFADVLAQSLAAGVPMQLALRCAFASVPDKRLSATQSTVFRRLKNGASFTDALEHTGEFSRSFIEKLGHAEAVGCLDECLEKLARSERARGRRVMMAAIIALSVVVVLAVASTIAWGVIDAYRAYFRSLDDIMRSK